MLSIEKSIAAYDAEVKALLVSLCVWLCSGYVLSIEKSIAAYDAEVKALLLQQNREKAQIVLTKKKLVAREVVTSSHVFTALISVTTPPFVQ